MTPVRLLLSLPRWLPPLAAAWLFVQPVASPVAGLRAADPERPAAAAPPLPWLTSLRDAQQQALQQNQLLLVKFETTWCGWCRKLDDEMQQPKPREAASSPSAPVPAKASTTCQPPRSWPSQLNRVSRTRSGVGRSPGTWGTGSLVRFH